MAKITVFAQVIQKLPKDLIKSLVRKHGTDKHAKGFNTIYLYFQDRSAILASPPSPSERSGEGEGGDA